MLSGGAFTSKSAPRVAKTKQEIKVEPPGEPIYPPHYERLKALNPRNLVDIEDDYVDERARDVSNYTAAGKVVYMNPEDVPVGLFDPTQMEPDAAVIYFGKRRSGKSYMERECCYVHHKYYDRALVFTGTKHNGFYQRVPKECMPLRHRDKRLGFVPDKAVIQGFDPHILGRFMDMQGSMIEFEELWNEKGYRPEAIIIMDDCIAEKDLSAQAGNGSLNATYALGRHYGIKVVLMTQYPRAIGTVLRDNLDYAFVFKQESDLAIEAITKTYMGELNPVTAKELIRMTTKGEKGGDRSCLVIDMNPFAPASEKYFSYSCCPEDELPDFVIGSEKFQKECGFDKKAWLDRKRQVGQQS